MAIETFGANSSWTKVGKKTGGARGAGNYGGIYTDGNKKALVKQDQNSPNFDIAEYMSSKIFAAISPGTGATVKIMVPEGQERNIPGDGSNVYVRSEFFDNYSDMFQDMDQRMSKNNKPSNFFRKDGRPLLMGTRQKLSNLLSKAMDNLGYQGFEKVAPTSLLIGDFDMHVGNIGVIREDGQKPQLKRIDFGWGFANLTKDIRPHSKSKHLAGMGPTNHFREFPRRYKLTEEFVSGLNQAANADISAVLDESFDELKKYYNKPVLQKWAQHAMPENFGNRKVDDIDLSEVRTTLKEVMHARQASIKEFSIEIKLGLIAETTRKGFKKSYIIDRGELKKLVKENPEYFKKLISGEKELKLRDKNLRKSNTYKALLKKEILEVRNEILAEEKKLEGSNSGRLKVTKNNDPLHAAQSNPLALQIAKTIIENHDLFKHDTKIYKNDFVKAINNSKSLAFEDRKSFNSIVNKMGKKTYSKTEITTLISNSHFVKEQIAAIEQIKQRNVPNLKLSSTKPLLYKSRLNLTDTIN